MQQFYLELKGKNCLMSIIFISSSSISEWSRGKEFGVCYLLFGFNSGGTLFQQFLLELKKKKLVKVKLKSIIFITRSSMTEWSSGKEFGLSYLLLGFNSGVSLLQQF